MLMLKAIEIEIVEFHFFHSLVNSNGSIHVGLFLLCFACLPELPPQTDTYMDELHVIKLMPVHIDELIKMFLKLSMREESTCGSLFKEQTYLNLNLPSLLMQILI